MPRARLAVVNRGRGVVLSTLNETGFPIYRDVTYYDPKTQVLQQDDRAYNRHGHELYANVDANIPIKDYMHFRTFSIDYTEHTWAEGEGVASEPHHAVRRRSDLSASARDRTRAGQVPHRHDHRRAPCHVGERRAGETPPEDPVGLQPSELTPTTPMPPHPVRPDR